MIVDWKASDSSATVEVTGHDAMALVARVTENSSSG